VIKPNGAWVHYFRKPVSKIFVRTTSAAEAVELVLEDAAVSIQSELTVRNKILKVQ
jgi:hypothetical protein